MATHRTFHISTFWRPSLVDLNTQDLFDPTIDTHSWNRWRTAVNDKLMDNTKLREQHKQLTGYSHSLTQAPYSECLLVTRNTRLEAHRMMAPDTTDPAKKRILGTGQFIYYGIPRVTTKYGRGTKMQTSKTNTNGTERSNYEMIYLKKSRR